MRISLLAICAALALAVAAAVPAAAETDTFSATGTLALKKTDAQGRVLYAGPVRSPGFGKGTATNLATVNSDGTTSADIVVKFEFGSLQATTTGTVTTDSGGTTTFKGKGKLTGGTRAYKGAKGSFKYNGTSAANGSIAYKITDGKVTFPTR